MRTVPAQQPDSTEAPEGVTDPPPADPFPDDPCIGPPPFAGTEPAGDTEAEREANRAAEAEAFAAFLEENCPERTARDPEPGGRPVGEPTDPFPDDPCIGPPPFAGSEPAGDTEAEREANRAAEAEAFTAFRDENCPHDPQVGPRASRPAGPPEGLPAGPPEETQAGPPAETPAGPPEGTPAGPPDGLPPG